jgi:hypothetical protein
MSSIVAILGMTGVGLFLLSWNGALRRSGFFVSQICLELKASGRRHHFLAEIIHKLLQFIYQASPFFAV